MTFETLKEQLVNLPKTELDKFAAWKNAGQVKRRWFAFAGGVIVGAGIVLLLGGLLGCSSKPTACERQSHSACFPGPKVVAE